MARYAPGEGLLDAGVPDMTPALSGQHALVTGGGRGIGLAIAARLAGLGAAVTITGRDTARLAEAASRLDGVQGIACDVTDADGVTAMAQEAAERFGPITILVANAGQAVAKPFAKSGAEDLRAMLAVNLEGTWNAIQAVLPGMVQGGSGRIVAVASTAGLIGYPYVSAYVAAKHGVVGLVRALALELAGKGITVNAVCPGYTETDIVADAVANITAKTGRTEEEARAELARRNPQGRLIDPSEVAEMVAFLVGEGARGISGQAIAIDGGEVAG